MENTEFSKFIEELKAKNDIVQVISSYIPLERKGRTYWARCPFHGEKTPSFAVNEIDQFYHCFGCKAGGDVIKFVMEMESVDYMGAVSILAEKANMQVPSFKNGNNVNDDIAEKKKHKDRLIALMKCAAKHYNKNLFEGKNPEALNYLVNQRHVSREVAAMFGLGASIDYTEIIDYLKKEGYTEKEILDSGVAKINGRNEMYDAVGKRLVFPLIDIMGNVIGFCGRVLEKKVDFAKYINTAETLLFSKGKTLYGINLVKKHKQDNPQDQIKYLIIVEGQMDVVSLHKAGFNTAVASMGTALTENQAKLIKRFTDNVLICYDGDFAGQKATLRGLEILKENGLNVKVVSLPEGMDPDDVINKQGKDAYIKLLKDALPLLDFKLELVKKRSDLSTKEGKSKYIEDALNVLREINSDVEREVYIDVVSEVSGTNVDFLKRQLAGEKIETKTNAQVREEYSRKAVDTIDSAIIKAQKFVLSCIIHLKPFAHFEKDFSQIFVGDGYIEIAKAIQANRNSVSTKQMIDKCKEYLLDSYDELFSEIINYEIAYGDEENENKYFKDSLWIIYKNYLDNELEVLNKRLLCEQDNAERRKIIAKIAEIVNKIRLKKVDL